MWIVHTNEHPRGVFVGNHVPEARIEKRMWEYIREKRRKGIPLNEIHYAWGRVIVSPLP